MFHSFTSSVTAATTELRPHFHLQRRQRTANTVTRAIIRRDSRIRQSFRGNPGDNRCDFVASGLE
jgi:hypothetical protein